MSNNNDVKINLEEGIYIPNIEACWLYKENKEEGNYTVQEKYLDKLLKGKLDFSFELVENIDLINNIEIKERDGKYYTLDIVNVKFNNVFKSKEEKKTTKELRFWTYTKGFKFNNKKFSNWKRSGGKARTGECLFIIDNIKDKCLDWARMGLEFNGKVDIASIRAYESLPLSSIIGTLEIDPKSILVIDDFNSKFNWEMSKTELINKELVTKVEMVKENNSIWDGQGLLDVTIFNSNKLLKGKGMALLRNRFFKCCVFNTNIQQFYIDYCSKNNIDYNTYAIEDMYGNKIKVKDIRFITTPNSIKIRKFNDEVLKVEEYKDLGEGAWLRYWKDNVSSTFGICKTEKPSKFENGKYNRLSYQMFNTIPFLRKEVTELAAKEINYIEKLKDDLDFFLEEANIDTDVENITEGGEYIEIGENIDVTGAFTEMVKKNTDFQKTQVFKEYRRSFISAKIRELRRGKIRVEGDYCTLCSNPIEMLYATVGEFKGQAITLVGNQINCPRFVDKEDVVGFRNPHICRGNIANLINAKNDLIEKYINCTNNIVVINSIKYPILTILQGADMDSDTMLITNNKTVVEACARLDWDKTPIPINFVENTGKNNAKMTGENMCNIDVVIAQNFIGEDINLSQELNSLMNNLENNNKLTEKSKEDIYSKISKCSSISCVEIDKAKKQFKDLNVTKELEKCTKGMEAISEEDNRRLKPYFFKFCGDNKVQKKRRKNNKAHRKELDKKTTEQFAKDKGIDIKDVNVKDKELVKLLKKNDKIQKAWEEAEFKATDTQMDWLEEELDKIKDANRIGTVQVIQLLKKNKHKADKEIVEEVVESIKDLNEKIKGYKLDLDVDYVERQEKIKMAKQETIEEIKKIKITKTNMYGILKECLNSVKKNGKINKKTGIESIALEILFATFGTGLLDMFLEK